MLLCSNQTETGNECKLCGNSFKIMFILFVLVRTPPYLQVGKETVKTSKDEELKKDMPPSFDIVEDACTKLVEASEGLREDQSSQPHHVLLLAGARGTVTSYI